MTPLEGIEHGKAKGDTRKPFCVETLGAVGCGGGGCGVQEGSETLAEHGVRRSLLNLRRKIVKLPPKVAERSQRRRRPARAVQCLGEQDEFIE